MAINAKDIKVDNYGDFVLNSNGGLDIVDTTESTKQICIFRLKTAWNDYAPNPDIAADIDGGIGAMNSRQTADELSSRISLALTGDQFLSESDFFVKIIPTSATAAIVALLVNSRNGFTLEEFSVSFTYDYVTGNIQMLDEL
jgi:hypothetical protein